MRTRNLSPKAHQYQPLCLEKAETRKFADCVSEVRAFLWAASTELVRQKLIEGNKEYLLDLKDIYGSMAVHQHSGTTTPFAASKNGLVAVVFSQMITIHDAIADD